MLEAAHAAYAAANNASFSDYRERSAELWLAWRQRVDGLTAEYEARVDAIRAGRADAGA